MTTTALATSAPPATTAAVLALSPGYSTAAADAAIAWALGQVEDYCGRRFAKRTNHVITVSAAGGLALLPDPPVTEVTKVESLTAWPLFTPLDWHDVDGFHCTPNGELYDARGFFAGYQVPWSGLSHGLRVTYTHGFDEWPAAVTSAVTALAAAFIVNPAGMATRRVLDVTYMWSDGVGPGGVADPFSGLSEYVLAEVS